MVNAPRIIAQIVLVGSQIIGRAFVEAYKQAAAQSARQAAGGVAGQSANDAVTRKTGLTVDEAAMILNVDLSAMSIEEIMKRYEHLFNVNDPSKGGSFYIQSKVFRAKERLEMELKKMTEKMQEEDTKIPK